MNPATGNQPSIIRRVVLIAGKIADLLLLDADPLIDVSNSRRIFAVVQGGKLLDRAALDGLLAGAVRK